MRQVFIDARLGPGASAQISGEDYHHLTRSLRAKIAEPLLLVDLDGLRFECIIESINRQAAQVRALRALDPEPEPPMLSVALCVPKSDALDASLDAATQLGATRFIPLNSARSQIIIGGRQPRWKRIVRESCCQCLRAKPMQILEPCSFGDFLGQAEPGAKLMAWQGGGPAPAISSAQPLQLLIGPEGGFEDSEISAAREAGWSMLSLGPRVLRVPVALTAALGALQAGRMA